MNNLLLLLVENKEVLSADGREQRVSDRDQSVDGDGGLPDVVDFYVGLDLIGLQISHRNVRVCIQEEQLMTQQSHSDLSLIGSFGELFS